MNMSPESPPSSKKKTKRNKENSPSVSPSKLVADLFQKVKKDLNVSNPFVSYRGSKSTDGAKNFKNTAIYS